MKRKLGTCISLVLVLTMLLSMVPAALAATSESKVMAPGDIAVITYAAASGVDKSKLYWESSKTAVADVAHAQASSEESDTNANTKNTITAKAAGTATIRVYEDSTKKKALYTWDVTVTEWKLTLKLDNKTITTDTKITDPIKISVGKSATLTATVTGPKGQVQGATVQFTTNDKDKVFLNDYKDSIEGTITKKPTSSGNTETSSVDVTLKAGTGVGNTTITVKVTKSGTGGLVDNSKNKSSTIGIPMYSNGVDWTFELKTHSLTVSTGLKQVKQDALIPTSTTGSYDYTYYYKKGKDYVPAGATDLTEPIEITDKGYITTRKTATVQVRVYQKGFEDPSYPHDDITIYITDKVASSISIDYQNDAVRNGINKTHVLAVRDDSDKDTDMVLSGPESTRVMMTSVELKADVSFGAGVTVSDTDKNRVTWTIKNGTGSMASFANNNSKLTTTGSAVTLWAVAPGTVTVTATIDGKTSNTMTITIWQGRQYNGSSYEKPEISSPISSTDAAEEAFKKQGVTLTLKNVTGSGKTVDREIIDAASLNAGTPKAPKIQLRGTVEAFDADKKIVYYPDTDGYQTFTIGDLEVSNIEIKSLMQNVSGKLNDKIELSVAAGVNNGELKSVTWYNQNHEPIQKDDLSEKKLKNYTSTLDLTGKFTSEGAYSFYAVIEDSNGKKLESGIMSVTIGSDYIVKITADKTTIKPGDKLTLSAVAQQYTSKGYTDVSGSYTVNWSVNDTSVATISGSGKTATLTIKSGGKVTVTATTTISGKTYTGTKEFTSNLPTAENVQLMLEEGANYVLLDGSKLSEAVKAVTGTTPSTFSFTQPTGGSIYSSSALTSTVSTAGRYASGDVSRMAFKPTSTAASYTLSYTAYGSDGGQLATGKLLIMTNAGSVSYHISAGESQTMQVSDFRNVYGSGLSYVVFGTASDSRGTLYKGKTASAGRVGSESYYATSGTNLLSNVTFIAGASTAKYTVTIPFTAYGSSGTAYGNLVIYVNDTHSIYSTGASFKSMSIADELAPATGASNAYVTIDSVIGGRLYSQYTSIKSCTELSTRDYGSTKFYLSGANSVDNLYILPVADSKTIEVNYTLNGSEKGEIKFKVIQQTSSSKFSDMAGSSKWAANSVDFMYANGLVNGVTATSFGPEQNMTRAMLVTILYRAAGEPTVTGIANKFTDNEEKQYYYNAVLWASSKGIVNGASATTFDPEGKITREQIAAILYRYAGSPAVSTTALSGFSDQSQVSSYAVTAMQWAVGTGIITGVSNNGRTTLSAKNNATRAQVSVMLHRFLTF